MNEQMQEAAKLLLSTLTETKEFVLAQAPEIMQQMITWQITIGAVSVCMFLVCFASFLVLFVKGIKAEKAPSDIYTLCTGIALTCSGCAFVFVLIDGTAALQAIVAPKLFLLEQITRLL